MSSTRHASPDRPIAHERYMSDPLYVERRALNGRAVAEKAATIENAETRRLILFLQGVSVECNGLKVVADWLCENGGEWIGSPATATRRSRGDRFAGTPSHVQRTVSQSSG